MKGKYAFLIIAITAILITLCIIWYNIFAVSNDENDYINGSYVKYYHGEDAKVFFDDYADTSEYEDIAFHFYDNRKNFSYLQKDWTYFVVDVYYTNEKYDEVTNSLLLKLGKSEVFNTENPFAMYKISGDNLIYSYNAAFIGFDEKHSTIRYAFVCDVSEGYSFLIQNYLHGLDWNWSKDDWIFDYSKDQTIT